MDLRRNKRYRLKASVTYSWEQTDGSKARGEAYTRDISCSGVFILTSDRLPSGTPVKLEIVLPSLHEKVPGASLQTQGDVVRSEESGFAAVADMGFRIQFSQDFPMERVFDKHSEEPRVEHTTSARRRSLSRFWM